ncbi:hypothetical protein [Vulcanisaeta distributa]|uniref:Atp6v0a2 ATPase, H+ transporting, lysosomal V0 subunit a2 n=1 Tax=Vulcanisaeta distributa (strain DSM 14429 / JCM 11212 / NBRC 100878 / IC-017) TaxID=572478 RepID=E1QPQ8_VULDI|nr:hypothetical protein [Vulcanisaeta distributa]ADN50354.1 atp6v0a2; ATPase, H+ transporting, lysosomal V0 subunit a2 [Vulcanisaeta distributa DSM 14429]
MAKNGKKRIVIEVDEQQYKELKKLKQIYHSKSWADLLIKCLDNSLIMAEIMAIHNDIRDINRAISEISRLIREERI